MRIITLLILLVIASCSNKNRFVIEQQKYVPLYGTYTGLIPCANCPGIYFTLKLKEKNIYTSYAAYQNVPDIPYIDSGKYVFVDPKKISLQKEKRGHAFFMVENNQLQFLDAAGNIIESDIPDLYILKKVDINAVSNVNQLEGKWILYEVMNREIKRGNVPAMPFLEFDINNNKVSGNASCNSISSSFMTEGDILLFNTFITTRMDCGDPLEAAVLEALLGPLRFSVEEDILILEKNEKEHLKFKRPK